MPKPAAVYTLRLLMVHRPQVYMAMPVASVGCVICAWGTLGWSCLTCMHGLHSHSQPLQGRQHGQ